MQLVFQQKKCLKSAIHILFFQIDMSHSVLCHVCRMGQLLHFVDRLINLQLCLTPVQAISFFLHLLCKSDINNMNKQSNNEVKFGQIEDDIFESAVMVDSPQEQEKRYQEAIRISMRSRGFEGKEDYPQHWKNSNNSKIAIKEPLTYEQDTLKNYGHQGILFKESPNFFGGWEERYCVLKNERFIYKEDHNLIGPNAGILNFNLLSCAIEGIKQGSLYLQFKITIANSDKTFVFKAGSLEETTNWVVKIRNAIDKSEGKGKNYSYLAHYPRFWRKDYESYSEFERTAETGDLVLFRGTKNSSMMQRVVTGDQFDHIAIVLLNIKGQILLFQANGGFGVGICPWSRFMAKKWFSQYDLIVHRHLNILRSDQFDKSVDKFIADNMGKKYNFSLKQYLFSRESTKESDCEFYFCSSLVSKLYKRLQLLDAKKSCTQYLPSWFSKEGNLRKDGRFGYAYLDDEKIVVFEDAK